MIVSGSSDELLNTSDFMMIDWELFGIYYQAGKALA